MSEVRWLLNGALLVVLCAICAACSGSHQIAVGERDGGRLGPDPRPDYDECGNGMDDDVDGQIDEACPCGATEQQACFVGTYPHRLVGLCEDGVQACSTDAGAEIGSWGECNGGVVPSDEVCDGALDEDCDGAVDEGCACALSALRPCAQIFSAGPCSPGTQRCQEDGTWSGCLGAIGPSAELCFDAIDNDCDGVVDDGCECQPEPERCADGIDNDCDDEVDEPSCVSAAECSACTWVAGPRITAAPSSAATLTFAPHYEQGLFAWQPSGIVASARSRDTVNVDLWRTDGTIIDRVDLNAIGGSRPISLRPDGEGFIAMYDSGPAESGVDIVRLGPTGEIVRQLALPAASGVGAIRVGDEIKVVSIEGGRAQLRTYDLSFALTTGPSDLGEIGALYWMDAIGDALAILWAGLGEAPELIFVRSDTPRAFPLTGLGPRDRLRLIEENSDSFLACATDPQAATPPLCQRMSAVDGTPIGVPFSVPSLHAVASDCGLIFASASSPGQEVHFDLHRFEGDQSVDSQAVVWSEDLQLRALWPMSAGRMLMVQTHLERNAGGPFLYEIGCGQPLPPTDCALARDLACDEISACCDDEASCVIKYAAGERVAPDPCALPPGFCDVPRGDCQRDLEQGITSCERRNFIVLPASCMLGEL